MASANKRKSTASRGRKKTTKKQSAPIRREIGATVCGLLALLTILCCFKVNAAFLDLMTSVFRGLIGAGFYILPFSFIMSFLILILHDGRPVALRVTCTFLTAMLIGSLVQLVGGKFDADWDWSVISALWDGGIDGTAGGVLAGGIASLLEALISRIGAAAVVIVGMLLSLITSLNMTVASIVTAIRNRPRAEYAEPQREHKDPAQVLVDTVANKHIEHVQRTEQRRASRRKRVRSAGRRSPSAGAAGEEDRGQEKRAGAPGRFCGKQPPAGEACRSTSARAAAGARPGGGGAAACPYGL